MSALEEYRKLADDRQWLIIDDIFDKADAAIAELEALVNANTDHMTEVGVELCREREARIAELERDNERAVAFGQASVTAGADWMRRADQAEAALAERDRMLEDLNPWYAKRARAKWLAYLKARAEEGSGVLTTAELKRRLASDGYDPHRAEEAKP